jgi:GPH family glycoside/pentoside/hexuronide:cation symporter
LVSLTLRISYSAFTLPFYAMGAELSADYVERSQLIVHRVLFNTVANLLRTFLGFRVFMSGGTGLLNRAAHIPFGWSCAALLARGGVPCAFGTLNQRGRLHAPTAPKGQAGIRLLFEIGEIFRSRSFVVLFATVLFLTAQGTGGVLALHTSKFFWKLPHEIIKCIAVAIAMADLPAFPSRV